MFKVITGYTSVILVRIVVFFFGCVLLHACSSKNKAETEIIQQFASKFTRLEPGYSYDVGSEETPATASTTRSAFFDHDLFIVLGYLSDTTSFYSFLYLQYAECPYLKVFSKSGKLISNERVAYCECIEDCHTNDCVSTLHVLDGNSVESYLRAANAKCGGFGYKMESGSVVIKKMKHSIDVSGNIVHGTEVVELKKRNEAI